MIAAKASFMPVGPGGRRGVSGRRGLEMDEPVRNSDEDGWAGQSCPMANLGVFRAREGGNAIGAEIERIDEHIRGHGP
jgi:hypothetical protein